MKAFFPFLFLLLLVACNQPAPKQEVKYRKHNKKNPHADGFLLQESDARAISLADEVMEAMGGRKAWDNTRYLHWNFFGLRKHTWDKKENVARIQLVDSDFKAIIDLDSLQGKIWKDGKELAQPDSLTKYLQWAKNLWINDSYWLFMPFKLKDKGVKLLYLREDSTLAGEPADVIEMTFFEVGNTPFNKYHVYISKESKRVVQWDYFSMRRDKEARLSCPWEDYQPYGNIYLSGKRGEDIGEISEIRVFEKLPASLFRNL